MNFQYLLLFKWRKSLINLQNILKPFLIEISRVRNLKLIAGRFNKVLWEISVLLARQALEILIVDL